MEKKNIEPLYEVVDDNDNPQGKFSISQIKKDNLIYRLIAVFVFNQEGKLFVQLRSKSKKRYPLHYASSVGGHVEVGESYIDAAKREMMEELGILEELDFICKKKIIYENHPRFVSLFKCITSKNMNLSSEELDGGQFCTVQEINKMIRQNITFTPVFLELFKSLYGENGS